MGVYIFLFIAKKELIFFFQLVPTIISFKDNSNFEISQVIIMHTSNKLSAPVGLKIFKHNHMVNFVFFFFGNWQKTCQKLSKIKKKTYISPGCLRLPARTAFDQLVINKIFAYLNCWKW